MKFDAIIEKNEKKVFESKGNKDLKEILIEMDDFIKKEAMKEKK